MWADVFLLYFIVIGWDPVVTGGWKCFLECCGHDKGKIPLCTPSGSYQAYVLILVFVLTWLLCNLSKVLDDSGYSREAKVREGETEKKHDLSKYLE